MAIPLAAAILGAAAIQGGASIFGALSGNSAANKASRRQTAMGNRAIDTQKQLFGETKAELSPFINAGKEGLSQLSRRTLAGDFTKPFTAEMMNADPGLQYRMSQANLALERSASARGRLLSGGTIRNIAELNQSLASQEYGAAYERNRTSNLDEFNQLALLSNVGLNAAGSLAGARQNLGSSLSELYTGIGNAQGASAMRQGANNQNLASNLGNIASSTLLQFGGAPGVSPQSAQPTNFGVTPADQYGKNSSLIYT